MSECGMKLEKLSIDAQDGLRLLAKQWENDELLFDSLASTATEWAWWWFRLREMEDRPVPEREVGYASTDRATADK